MSLARIEAFSYFLKTIPDNPQAPSDLSSARTRLSAKPECRRRHRRFELSDLELPGAKEREAAIQQKALLLGEQNREPEMAQDFPAITQGISEK